jgi:hypothetical protein
MRERDVKRSGSGQHIRWFEGMRMVYRQLGKFTVTARPSYRDGPYRSKMSAQRFGGGVNPAEHSQARNPTRLRLLLAGGQHITPEQYDMHGGLSLHFNLFFPDETFVLHPNTFSSSSADGHYLSYSQSPYYELKRHD